MEKHKQSQSELVITYDTKGGNHTLCPRIFYALYIEPNGDGNGHLIYTLSLDKILVTMKYQSVPIHKDLIKMMNKTDSSDNKIQISHFNIEQSVVQDDHSNNNKYDSQTPSNDRDNSKDGSHGELDSSQQLKDLKSNKIINHEDQDILTKELNSSTSVSVAGLTSTGTFMQGLFLQYLHKTVVTILCLSDLYIGISTIVGLYLLLSLQLSIQVSLQKIFYVVSTMISLSLHTYYRL